MGHEHGTQRLDRGIYMTCTRYGQKVNSWHCKFEMEAVLLQRHIGWLKLSALKLPQTGQLNMLSVSNWRETVGCYELTCACAACELAKSRGEVDRLLVV
jgi:hypothetical protein